MAHEFRFVHRVRSYGAKTGCHASVHRGLVRSKSLIDDRTRTTHREYARRGTRHGSYPTRAFPIAIVGDAVELDPAATVGPYCVIDGRVKIGARSHVLAHTVIEGTTFVGAGCRLGPHAAIGTAPQHRGHDDGAETYAVIEDDVAVREFATIHRATKPGIEQATRVGRGSVMMVGAHVAHDCRLGEHVTIGDASFVGGGVVVHQFCRIGRLAIVSGGEIVSKDIVPFGAFKHAGHRAYNAVGCRRAKLPGPVVRSLRDAFRRMHDSPSFAQAAAAMRRAGDADWTAEVRELVEFIESSGRGVHASASVGSVHDE